MEFCQKVLLYVMLQISYFCTTDTRVMVSYVDFMECSGTPENPFIGEHSLVTTLRENPSR